VEEVVLGPGDSLYLPPFYFHQVEALEPRWTRIYIALSYAAILGLYDLSLFEFRFSVSVNIYRESPAKTVLAEALKRLPSLPTYLPGYSREQVLNVRAEVARDVSVAVVTTVLLNDHNRRKVDPPHPAPIRFLRNLFRSRLSSTAYDPMLSWDAHFPFVNTSLRICEKPNPVPVEDEHVALLVQSVAEVLLSFPVYGALQSALADYVETVVNDAVGPALTWQFFRDCFNVTLA
jgi:hypothetical protein